MIKRILTYYASRLDEYLRHKFPQPEGVAEVGFIGNCADERPCKLIVSLVNIGRHIIRHQPGRHELCADLSAAAAEP